MEGSLGGQTGIPPSLLRKAADVTGQAEGAALGEVDVSAHEGLGKDDQPADVGVGRDRPFLRHQTRTRR